MPVALRRERAQTRLACGVNDEQLMRYSRQIMLPGFGVEAQQRLLDARVLVVGLGGLGSPVAMYLAAAGAGTLLLADFDAVDLSNLQRQLLHSGADLGRTKVDSAIDRLRGLNSDIELEPIKGSLNAERLAELAGRVDLIVDCCDNFATRFAVNAACVAHRIPLVSGAAIRTEGQVCIFSGQPGAPCCLRWWASSAACRPPRPSRYSPALENRCSDACCCSTHCIWNGVAFVCQLTPLVLSAALVPSLRVSRDATSAERLSTSTAIPRR